jgi:hypothetical protein
MMRLIFAFFVLFLCRTAIAAPKSARRAAPQYAPRYTPRYKVLPRSTRPEPNGLELAPFTQATNYLSLFGFLRQRYFGSDGFVPGGLVPGESDSVEDISPPVVDLKGTTWTGTDIYVGRTFVPYKYTFGADGILTYSYQGNTYRNGTWRQNGNAVYMETNKKYSERVGLIEGSHIKGVGRNLVGQSWNWEASR